MLHAPQFREANAADARNETQLHTGSQWVILDRAFCRYLVTEERALYWMRVRTQRDAPWCAVCRGHARNRHTRREYTQRGYTLLAACASVAPGPLRAVTT